MKTQSQKQLPGTLLLGWKRTAHELRLYFREWDAVVFIFFYPAVMMLIFGSVFDEVLDLGPAGEISFSQYFLPGMVATGILLASFQNLALNIAQERDEGGLKRLRGTPLPPLSYFLGKTGQLLVTTLAQNAMLLAVAAWLLDVPLPTSATAWLTFTWVFILGTATGAVLGVAFSSLPRSGRSAAAVVIPVVLVLQFTSGIFFPFFQLPEWMQSGSALFPLKWIAQGMRAVFLPDEASAMEPTGEWELVRVALVLGAWLLVGLVVGTRTFKWRRRDDG